MNALGALKETFKILFWYFKALVRLFVRCVREVSETLEGAAFDARCGIDTYREDESGKGSGLHGDADVYEASSYAEIRAIFRRLEPTERDIFVDLGCGKGRVLYEACKQRFKKCVGVEHLAPLCALAEENLKKLPKDHAPFEIHRQDAALWRFEDETVVFIFNAFGWKTFRKTLDNLRESLTRNPRPLSIVYFGPYVDPLGAEEWLKSEGRVAGTDFRIWKHVPETL